MKSFRLITLLCMLSYGCLLALAQQNIDSAIDKIRKNHTAEVEIIYTEKRIPSTKKIAVETLTIVGESRELYEMIRKAIETDRLHAEKYKTVSNDVISIWFSNEKYRITYCLTGSPKDWIFTSKKDMN